jgi:hypothetical protein
VASAGSGRLRQYRSEHPLDTEPEDRLTTMDLLHFARGWGLKIALGIFCLGVTWRIVSFALLRIRREYSRPRESVFKYLLGGLITVGSRSWPHREFIGRTGAGEALGYSYHLGLFAVVLLFTPHILFLEACLVLPGPGCRAASLPSSQCSRLRCSWPCFSGASPTG